MNENQVKAEQSNCCNNNPARIALFSDTFLPIVDGVGRVVYRYANTLGKRGHECYVVCPQKKADYEEGDFPFEIVDFFGIPVPGSKEYNTGFPRLDMHYAKRIDKINFDIIHAHSPGPTGMEAKKIAKKRGIPLIGTFHSKYYDDVYRITHSKAIAKFGAQIVADFYNHCDEVWTVSQDAADTLRSYGFHGNIEIVSNGTEVKEINAADIALAKETFSIPDDIPVLLFAGRIVWGKGVKMIVDAAAKLKREGTPFFLIFAGHGQDEKALASLLLEKGLSECSLLSGHISNPHLLDGLYALSSLFLFPSLYDTFGLVVNEAATMGTPSIVIKNTAPAESIIDGYNGYLCENTADSLAETIKKALLDKKALAAVSAAARETIPIPWDTILDTVEDRYQSLISRKLK